ncbi:RND efflux system outer membrane lipoprotein [Neokomagataea thailandica NBRC 106555]|uniref:Efflux transporter outer membrane subunit n=2 Tax=Neokomagataea TaxID=1223423 RepID=A0A4Y6V4E5_9PROT|nr:MULTISPECIES: efflux transporter outer membrane subunit [Neokomagataea]QDH24992.1 efflux transporter outer membrane subunit [Neokomagataea tanensis]GBR51544.1 RND efflux system outer membrane lipoprotein [Neokomagataea thailandica NBRC 106555]
MKEGLRRVLGVSSAIFFAGCTVGPNYKTPHVTGLEHWGNEPIAPSVTYAGEVDVAWWRSFKDEELNHLVERLGQQNLILQEAATRISAARSQVRIAAAQGLPSVNWAGAYTWTQQSTRGFLSLAEPRAGANLQYNYYTNIASAGWDLDLFGMVRRAVEAGRAEADAAVAARRAVALASVSDLVSAYMRLRGTQEQRMLTEHNLALARHDLALVQDRVRDGAATELELAEAKARVASTQSALAPLRAEESALMNAMASLLALPPRALEGELSPVRPQPSVPGVVPVGLPSTLAQRRPDIMLADARLHAATARVGMAKASFYPDIVLAGNLGTQSLSAGDFFLPVAKYFTLGPTLNVPIFEGGRLRGELHLCEAAQQEAALAYRQTVLDAWRDVDDALTGYAQIQDQKARLDEAVQQNRLALAAARQRYVAGAVPFLEVDEAQARVLASETSLAAVQTKMNTQLVDLYRALGGGWQFTEPLASLHKD